MLKSSASVVDLMITLSLRLRPHAFQPSFRARAALRSFSTCNRTGVSVTAPLFGGAAGNHSFFENWKEITMTSSRHLSFLARQWLEPDNAARGCKSPGAAVEPFERGGGGTGGAPGVSVQATEQPAANAAGETKAPAPAAPAASGGTQQIARPIQSRRVARASAKARRRQQGDRRGDEGGAGQGQHGDGCRQPANWPRGLSAAPRRSVLRPQHRHAWQRRGQVQQGPAGVCQAWPRWSRSATTSRARS